jgi:adenylate kinase family enzyme
MPPLDEFRARVDAATRRGGWVVDGNYGKVRDIVWTRADTVVWLDLPLLITIWRVALRTIRRVRRRKMLWGGNGERLSSALFGRDSLWLYNIRTFRRRQRTYATVGDRTEFGATRLVRLRNQRDIEEWLADLKAEAQR